MAGCWVYILKCADNSYYVGTSRCEYIESRLSEHQMGIYKNAYTHERRPVTLAWAEHFEMIIDAIAAERKIKGWRREKKEAMMRGDYDALPWLAKRSAVRARSFEARPRGLAPQDEDPHHPHPEVRALASLEGRVPQGKEQE